MFQLRLKLYEGDPDSEWKDEGVIGKTFGLCFFLLFFG